MLYYQVVIFHPLNMNIQIDTKKKPYHTWIPSFTICILDAEGIKQKWNASEILQSVMYVPEPHCHLHNAPILSLIAQVHWFITICILLFIYLYFNMRVVWYWTHPTSVRTVWWDTWMLHGCMALVLILVPIKHQHCQGILIKVNGWIQCHILLSPPLAFGIAMSRLDSFL